MSTDRGDILDRVEIARHHFTRMLGAFEFVSGDNPDQYEADIRLRLFKELKLVRGTTRETALLRTRRHLSDGNNDVALIAPLRGKIGLSQRGREFDVEPGTAGLLTYSEPCAMQEFDNDAMRILVPREVMAKLVPRLEEKLARPLAPGNEALRLLVGYLCVLENEGTMASPDLGRLAVAHVHDLLALAIGAGRDAAEQAAMRGLKAARAQAVKAYIDEHIGPCAISAEDVAAHVGISERYVRKLFEAEGTSFSAYVAEQRLRYAWRMLRSPRHTALSISAIAYEAGFGDLSYFNRLFRRLFGATPSEVRAEGMR
jgi:AraC-like DNA-binding protein